MEVQSRMGPVTASTVEEVSAEGEEDPQPDSTSGDKLQVGRVRFTEQSLYAISVKEFLSHLHSFILLKVTSSSEVVKKQVDGGDMDTLEVSSFGKQLGLSWSSV